MDKIYTLLLEPLKQEPETAKAVLTLIAKENSYKNTVTLWKNEKSMAIKVISPDLEFINALLKDKDYKFLGIIMNEGRPIITTGFPN